MKTSLCLNEVNQYIYFTSRNLIVQPLLTGYQTTSPYRTVTITRRLGKSGVFILYYYNFGKNITRNVNENTNDCTFSTWYHKFFEEHDIPNLNLTNVPEVDVWYLSSLTLTGQLHLFNGRWQIVSRSVCDLWVIYKRFIKKRNLKLYFFSVHNSPPFLCFGQYNFECTFPLR